MDVAPGGDAGHAEVGGQSGAGTIDAGGTGGTDEAGVPTMQADDGGSAGDPGSNVCQISGESDVLPCQKLGTEVCNGGDDDCDKIVDGDCTYTIDWTRACDEPALGHALGGVNFSEQCPPGSVLAGLRIGMGQRLDQVSAICRQLELHVDTTKTPPAFSATLGPRFPDSSLAPPTTSDTKSKLQDLPCADGSVVSGADGTTTTDTPRYILGIRLTCAPVIVSIVAGKPVLGFDGTQEETAGPIVYDMGTTTQAFNYTMTIAAGHIATGIFGGDGFWVDRVGFSSSLGSIVSR